MDRYPFDLRICTYADGWAQVDTEQDAHYFGQWVNPWKRRFASYVEGDCKLVEFETDAELADHLRELDTWNQEQGFRPVKVDMGLSRRQEFTDRFNELGLAGMIH